MGEILFWTGLIGLLSFALGCLAMLVLFLLATRSPKTPPKDQPGMTWRERQALEGRVTRAKSFAEL